jgi:hypothetical protein
MSAPAITRAAIAAVCNKIHTYVRRRPVIEAVAGEFRLGEGALAMKLEQLQTGRIVQRARRVCVSKVGAATASCGKTAGGGRTENQAARNDYCATEFLPFESETYSQFRSRTDDRRSRATRYAGALRGVHCRDGGVGRDMLYRALELGQPVDVKVRPPPSAPRPDVPNRVRVRAGGRACQ